MNIFKLIKDFFYLPKITLLEYERKTKSTLVDKLKALYPNGYIKHVQDWEYSPYQSGIRMKDGFPANYPDLLALMEKNARQLGKTDLISEYFKYMYPTIQEALDAIPTNAGNNTYTITVNPPEETGPIIE